MTATPRWGRTLVAVTFASMVLAGCSASAPSPTVGTPTVSGQQQVEPLGPSGYGALQLGMTMEEATATGELREECGPRAVPCPQLRDAPPSQGTVCVSDRLGVVAIFAFDGVRTPEAIGLGSTVAQVKAAYPEFTMNVNGPSAVPVPRNPQASYYFQLDDNGVYELALADDDQDCFS